MNIVIIGNGPAGTTAASKIRQLDKESKITILSYEKYPYYARPRLHEVIDGKSSADGIRIFKPEWYQTNNIELKLDFLVTHIDTAKQLVIGNEDEISYDKLLIASGAYPFLPDVDGINSDNVLTLRTVDDALKIKELAETKKEIVILGGGLLGLELANCLAEENKIIKVIEVGKTLLCRQLDEKKGEKLREILESRGIEFHLCEICEKIVELENGVEVITKAGKSIKGDIVIVSAGVRARLELARESNIATEKGIIVDKNLATNFDNIYAAGDCIEFNGKLYGFVKSAIEQGNIVGENIALGNKKEYTDTQIDVRLKVSGIDLNTL